jgi:hypothetical protein
MYAKNSFGVIRGLLLGRDDTKEKKEKMKKKEKEKKEK